MTRSLLLLKMHSGKLSALMPLACFTALLLPAAARADDWVGARGAGRGGTGLADASDVGAAATNVATLSLGERYDLSAGGVAGPDSTWMGRIAAVDSRTSIVTLGATYSYRSDDVAPPSSALPGWSILGQQVTNLTSHQGVTLGLAYPFLSRRMAVGLTGRFDWRASEQEGDAEAFNFGASLAARPWDPLTLALSVQNVLDLGYPDTRRLVDLGVRWELGKYLAFEGQLRTEWMGDPFAESLAEHLGVDVGVTSWLHLGAGWQHEDGDHRVGGGLSLVSEKAELDYSLTGEIGADPARLWHGVDLRVHF